MHFGGHLAVKFFKVKNKFYNFSINEFFVIKNSNYVKNLSIDEINISNAL